VKYPAVLLAVALAERIAKREWIMSRGSVHGAAVDRTAWSAWKPEGLDLMPASVARR